MKLLSLFLSFAKVGVMTFGGGYAMIPPNVPATLYPMNVAVLTAITPGVH